MEQKVRSFIYNSIINKASIALCYRGENLYNENYKALMKESEENKNCKDIS